MYNNEFPAITNKNIGLVRIFPTPTTNKEINRLNAQILIKSDSMQKAEAKAWEIYEDLRIQTHFLIGDTMIIYCSTNQPEFIQSVDSGAFLYSVNLQLITDQQGG